MRSLAPSLLLLLVACAAESVDTGAAGTAEIVPTLTQVETFPVFRSGDGYHTYRIPSVIETRAGTLLAFAEGREGSAADRRQNDIVLRRSTDNGETWQPLQVVAEQGVHSLNDPTPIEVTEGPTAGRVYLMMRRVSCQQSGIGAACEPIGDLPYAPLLTWTDDDGQTWSPLRDLSADTLDPTDAVGPGIGLELTSEAYRGRLVFPLWGRGLNYALYSDDGGDTWVAGEPSSIDETETTANEAQIAELSDGRLWLNARHSSTEGVFASAWRKVAFSEDGGSTWSALSDDLQLPDQQVMASVLTVGRASEGERDRLLFSNPVDFFRSTGTVRLSYDDGRTWPIERTLVEGSFQYNTLVRLDCKHVGSLYEQGEIVEEIRFARFSIDWLTDGDDTPICEE